MLEDLLAQLNSPDSAMQEQACQKARQLLPEQLVRLAQMEATHAAEREDAPQSVLPDTANRSLLSRLRAFVAVLVSGKLGVRESTNLPATPAQRCLAEIVADTDDPRFIALALTLLGARTDAAVLSMTRQALTRLLPRLTESEAALLTHEQRQQLLDMIRFAPYFEIELTLAILEAVERFGDAEAIPEIASFARQGYWSDYTTAPGSSARRDAKIALVGAKPEQVALVRLYAQRCLKQLQNRASAAQLSHTLLRPSSASTLATSDTLLRPAAPSSAETPPEELLRPVPPKEARNE